MNEDDVLVPKSDRLESIVPLSDVETGRQPCLSIMSERKCSFAKTYSYLDMIVARIFLVPDSIVTIYNHITCEPTLN